MNFLSVCSGAEAFGPAWHKMGFRAVGHAEIEPNAAAVLRFHYPEVKNHGDFTTIKSDEYPTKSVQLLIGGTPCQAFSLAGLQGGLDDPRGELTLKFLLLAKQIGPEWILWENVPGVLSNDGGRTFGTFLGGLAQLGYGFAYRVLDAQYLGVPQRRRRVFVVAHLGDWRRAAAVLFESHSLQGHPAPVRSQGGRITAPVTARLAAGGPNGKDNREDFLTVGLTLHGNDGTTSILTETDTAACLRARAPGTIENSTTTIAFALRGRSAGAVPEVHGDGLTAGSLRAASGGPRCDYLAGMHVRRLTPRECERLQGWPDDWTRYGINGKGKHYELPDSARYRIIGNGWAAPVANWIAGRIKMVDAL